MKIRGRNIVQMNMLFDEFRYEEPLATNIVCGCECSACEIAGDCNGTLCNTYCTCDCHDEIYAWRGADFEIVGLNSIGATVGVTRSLSTTHSVSGASSLRFEGTSSNNTTAMFLLANNSPTAKVGDRRYVTFWMRGTTSEHRVKMMWEAGGSSTASADALAFHFTWSGEHWDFTNGNLQTNMAFNQGQGAFVGGSRNLTQWVKVGGVLTEAAAGRINTSTAANSGVNPRLMVTSAGAVDLYFDDFKYARTWDSEGSPTFAEAHTAP
jgi:hypothetical protein